MSDEQRERDLAYFREWRPHVRAHDIPEWFADGAAYARATDPVRRFLAHPRGAAIETCVGGGCVVCVSTEGDRAPFQHFDGPTADEACERALRFLEESDG